MTFSCPNCGKKVTLSNESREIAFCEYCGYKIHLNVDANHAQVHKTGFYEFCKSNPLYVCIIVVLLFILLGFGLNFGITQYGNILDVVEHQAKLTALKEEEIAASHLAIGEVRMPNISTSEDARDVIKKLRDAGFINVVDKPKRDLILGNKYSQYEIIEITVDGAPSFEKGGWYPLDTEIVVSYHTFIIG